MFRRFMIVCWVLFSIGAAASLIGYVGYSINQEPERTIRELTPEEAENLVDVDDLMLEQKREIALAKARRLAEREDRQVRRQYFFGAAGMGGLFAGVLLLWNILCHTVHWIWMGRKES